MEIPKTIKLRGHHLWNQHSGLIEILQYESRGTLLKDSLYDKKTFEFLYEQRETDSRSMQKYILYVLANYPEAKVKIIDSEDDVCAVCRNKTDGKCNIKIDKGEKHLPGMDRNTARFYGFEIGKTYSAKEIFETLKQAKKIQMGYWPTRVVSVEEALAA
jgi:hypothetical protein